MNLRKILLLVISALSVFTLSCETKVPVASNANTNVALAGDNQNSHANHDMNDTKSAPEKPADFKIEMSPAAAEAGKETEFVFTIKDKNGNAVKDFKVVHEKKMHLIVVSEDLAEFEHLHPELQADGTFKIKHAFKHGGKFVLYPDATPENGSQIVQRIEINVAGAPKSDENLTVDTDFTKAVDGISVTMKPEAELKTGEQATINFIVNDAATGKPVTDLQNYLGELAHVVVISRDTKDFLHVHPMKNNRSGETSVMAHTKFPKAGIYKLWAQFQRGGKIITVPFVIDVKQGEAKTESSAAAKPENGAVKIRVDEKGFSPASIEIEKGKPVKLLFTRTDDKNCGSEVVFSSLNIKKQLPVGQEIAVEIAPKETGEINFACGMNMYKGKVVVQ